MKHLATSLIGALTLCAVAPAAFAAAPPDDLRRQVVSYADLDLTHPAGAQELYHRIRYAARDVCETSNYRLGPDRRCIEQAIARAVAEVGAPLLTTRHLAATDGQPPTPRQARIDE
jgi:UrcA family protein